MEDEKEIIRRSREIGYVLFGLGMIQFLLFSLSASSQEENCQSSRVKQCLSSERRIVRMPLFFFTTPPNIGLLLLHLRTSGQGRERKNPSFRKEEITLPLDRCANSNLSPFSISFEWNI